MNPEQYVSRLLACAGLLAISGCQTVGGLGGPGDVLNVTSDPPGAQLTIDGVGSCDTPCIIKIDTPQRARLSKAGFVTLNLTLSPSRKAVVIPMELAAASKEVDTQALPAID